MKNLTRVIALLFILSILLTSCEMLIEVPQSTESTESTTTAATEPVLSATVNGIAIEDFKIAVRYERYIEDGEKLSEKLGVYGDFRVPVVNYTELTGEEKGVICLGCLDTQGYKLITSYNGYRVSVSEDNGYMAGIAGSNETYYAAGFEAFMGQITHRITQEAVEIELPTKTFFDYTYKFTEGIAGPWTLDESKTVIEEVAEGLTYKEHYYYDASGAPHIANLIYVDTSIYTMSLGMPKSGSTYQAVSGQMQTAIDAGLEVVAAVNGDRWNSSAKLRGLTIQDGKLITRGTHNDPYFARTKSGELKFGLKGHEDDIDDLQMCVGGDFLLVNRGVPQHYNDITTNSHLSTSHPRTMVGLTDDGILILVTVDGRQSHSKGATMENAADLMASLGCYMAVSLDGGGSSTMVIKTPNGFDVKNSPSDGQERTVRNSLLIIKK